MVFKTHASINIDEVSPKEFIVIKGARVNNLKNLNVAIPRNKLIVITGLSGSGKSSLAFDTLFAEGQRMYVESLNSYARQFLSRMEKPAVDYIKGISPAIAIEQKVNTKNPRSTVGTTTEIYDYLKLLFARIGKTYSPVSGQVVKKDSVSDVVDYILSFQEGLAVLISFPLSVENRTIQNELALLLQKGFTRVLIKHELKFIEDVIQDKAYLKKVKPIDCQVLVDRLTLNKAEETLFRLGDSVQTAFYEGKGVCQVHVGDEKMVAFSNAFELDGILFEEPTVNFFSFNNSYGACKRCEGFGHVLGIDPDLVIPDKNLSVYEDAIAPWRTEAMSKWVEPLIANAMKFDFPIHRPYYELSDEQKKILWTGNSYFDGLDSFFQYIESKVHKIQYRVLLSRYRGRTVCPDCLGTRLRKDVSYVKINNRSIIDLVLLSIEDLVIFFNQLQLTAYEHSVAERLVTEVKNRLGYLQKVGLTYLTLNRLTSTLSGGEYQRIKLATSLGSSLVGSMYILDEPSIGLHPRDTHQLIEVLQSLKKMGNTVIVVEHEEEIMRAADQLIDIGPAAGSHGGELVFQGTVDELKHASSHSHTANYIIHHDRIPIPAVRRKAVDYIEIIGAREHNLKNLNVKIPLGLFTVITGVSGSGKSTLVRQVLYPALTKLQGIPGEETGKYDRLEGSIEKITQVELVDQHPIGKSSRSNPVTYIKAYDAIRQLFSEQPLAKNRGYQPAHFSFNVEGGRCDACQGEGVIQIEMQFMADVYLTCETCEGKRFKKEILDITYHDKHIADVLDMTIEDSLSFFKDKQTLVSKLQPLQEVGLGYIRLGQSSSTLSGGEAQRVKLASFLGKGNDKDDSHIFFIFDEPTTGLHFHDIHQLLRAMQALVERGHSVLVIEHNTQVIKCADWIIDLGPDGGNKGGMITFEGVPEKLIQLKNNHTAMYLKKCF